MASHLRLHLAAPPLVPLPHHRRLHLRRLPVPPAFPLLNPVRAPLPPPLPLLLLPSRNRPVRAVGGGSEEDGGGGLVGEDSAAFRLGGQSLASWAYFGGILAAVLFALNVLWIDPNTGFGTRFLDSVASISDSHEVRAVAILGGLSACFHAANFFHFCSFALVDAHE
jgi:zeta-carotene isomerase